MYINSPGGSVTALFAIYDTMQYIKPDVATVCIGMAASSGGGAPGRRAPRASATRSPRPGDDPPAARAAPRVRRPTSRSRRGRSCSMREQINEILAKHTGQTYEKVANDTERDFWMSADEAKDYGLVDAILTRRELAAVAAGAKGGGRDGAIRRRRRICSSAAFCGKSQKQVKKLIAGPGVYICDECIELCNEIIEEEFSALRGDQLLRAAQAEGDLRLPREYVVGQERAKKVLSVAVYNHYKRVRRRPARS